MHDVTAALEGFRPRFRRGSRGAAGGGKKSGGKKGGGKKLNPFFRAIAEKNYGLGDGIRGC